MRRLMVLLLFASALSAKPRDYTLYPPHIPEAVIVEIDAPIPQVNTFCAANLDCSVTGNWSFSNLIFGAGSVPMTALATTGTWGFNGTLTLSGNNTHSGTETFTGPASGPGLGEYNVKAYGAIGNDVADDTAAIQAAINAAAGSPVYIPAGTYKTTSDLLYSTCGDSGGLKIYGDGQLKSVIDPRQSNGWAIRIEGTCLAQLDTFQRHGYIHDIGINSGVPGANTGGIKATGTWFMRIYQVNIVNVTSDCIQFPIRTDLAANPDHYGNNYWSIEGSNLDSCGGFGFDQQDGPEGLGYIRRNNITSNVLGGAYVTGEGLEIRNNTFSFNGNSNNALATCAGPLAAGLFLDTGPAGSVDSTSVEDNEFDSNCFLNIWVRRSIGLRIGPNRQITHTNVVAQDSILRPPVSIRLDGVQLVESFEIADQRHRGDNGGINNRNQTLYQVVQAGVGSVSGGIIQDPLVAVGNISTNTTTFSVAGGAVFTVTQSGGVVQNSAVRVNGGAGYANTPVCSIIDQGGGGAGATCTAATTTGVVSALILTPGSGYTTGATVAFAGGGCAVQATGNVTTTNNGVSFLTLLTPGSGCATIPTCTISPVGAGSGATCTAGIAGVVATVTVTAGGAAYITPQVVINPNASDQGIASLSVAPTNIDIYDRTNTQSYLNVPAINLPMTTAGVFKWSTDLGLSRSAAGTLAVGNTTQGDISGTVRAASFIVSGGTGAITLTNNNATFSESSCAGASATNDILCANSTSHTFQASNNNGAFTPLVLSATSTTTTQALFATATAGIGGYRAIATADIATALTTPGPIGGTTPGTGKFTTLTETALLISNTAPTIAGAGCGGSAASIPSNNGTAAFTINVGTAPTAGGCTVTLPAATTGWNCFVTDITTNSVNVFLQKQTSSTTTSAVLVNYSDVAAATAPTASDIWRVSCFAY